MAPLKVTRLKTESGMVESGYRDDEERMEFLPSEW